MNPVVASEKLDAGSFGWRTHFRAWRVSGLRAGSIVRLALLAFLASAAMAQAQTAKNKPHIWGQITNNGKGAASVKVRLEVYDGEPCVQLAESTSPLSPDQEAVLQKCKRELSSVTTDASGEYHFRDLQPGWYRLSMVWILPAKPAEDTHYGMSRIGDYLVMLAANEKVDPPKYLVSAQGNTFRFQGEASERRDLPFTIDLGKNPGP